MKFKKMNTANSPPWRDLGVGFPLWRGQGEVKKIIHLFEFTDIMDRH